MSSGQADQGDGAEPVDPARIGDRLMQALIDAGIITRNATHVLIDVQWRTPVKVHVETLADPRLLDVLPAELVGAEVVRERPRAGEVGDDTAQS